MIYIYMTFLALIMASIYAVIINVKVESTNLVERISVSSVKELTFILLFLILSLPGALRKDVGIDYITYSNYQIPRVLAGDPNVKVEFLYKQIIKLGNWIGNGETYQYIFAITSFIITLFVILYIKDQSHNIVLSTFIFISGGFFAFSLSGMRQSIGIAISLYSLKFIKQKNLMKYVCWIVIASFFHSSVLIFLIFYFLDDFKFNPLIVPFIMIVGFVFARQIRNILIITSSKVGFYSSYFGGTFDTGIFNRLLAFLVVMITLFICFTYLYLGKNSLNGMETELNIHYFACMVVSVISVLPTPSRLLFVFIPIYIILIPNLINKYGNKIMRTLLYIGIFTFFAYFMYKNMYVQDDYHILPYKDIFGIFN